jgi:hypothetical protein
MKHTSETMGLDFGVHCVSDCSVSRGVTAFGEIQPLAVCMRERPMTG